MKTVKNEKTFRVFIRCFEQKLEKEVKQSKKALSKEQIAEIAQNIISHDFLKHENKLQHQFVKIIHENQEKIVDQQEKISRLKKKMQLEDQMTRQFFHNLMKDQSKNASFIAEKIIKKQSPLQPQGHPLITDFSLTESIVKSPTNENRQPNITETVYRPCSTSRSHSQLNKSRFQMSEYAQEVQPDEKEKVKALAKLRKLERYVFEKQSKSRKESRSKVWNSGISPTKRFYKQENNSLKTVNTHLLTHLELLQKFRDIPSIESIVAREEAIKKKENVLKDLDDTLTKKQFELTKKQSQFLKRQKSTKIL